MKKRTVCTAALLAVLGTSALLPAAANAATEEEIKAAREFTSSGKIEYVEDDGENEFIHPEEDVKVETDDEFEKNPNKGALKIDGVSPLDFKKQKAVLSDQSYFAVQREVTKIDPTTGTKITDKVGNYVQVTDKRIDNRTSWNLSVQMTEQFTSPTNNVLDNATIAFANPIINSLTDKTVSPWATVTSNQFELGFDKDAGKGNSVDVMGTADPKDGFGSYTIAFGNTAKYYTETGEGTQEDTTGTPSNDPNNPNKIENGSVTLKVPGVTVKTKEAYTAKLLWVLSEKI